MSNKKRKIYLIGVILIIGALFLIKQAKRDAPSDESMREVSPAVGTIQTFISTTGTVLPRNRLEIKPPINGRLESVLVKEGDKVTTGQTLAWMSSTERAALLDAARAKGEDIFKYWEDAYKPIPLLAPIDAEVIVAKVEPGQTVTSSEAVLVLSDRLIVRAQVDETDIGKVKLNQAAIVSLDAYPETKIKATVEHIYYESKVVNNVTIYEVDLIPEEVLPFFRSGMNATVDFIEQRKENILVIPVEAVQKEKERSSVLVSQGPGKEPIKRVIELGISDDKNVEIVSGVSANDKIIIKSQKYSLPKFKSATNPFTPFGRRRQ